MFAILKKKFKFLKRYDIFGCPINLTMKNEDTYKTMFGGLLTILINIFFITVLIYSFYKLFTKQNLETFKYQLNLGANYGHLDLNEKNFMIAVKFDYDTLNNWTHPYMNISINHVTQYRNSSLTWRITNKINMRPCKASDFTDLETDFYQLGLSSALCPSENSNMTVQGSYHEDVFAYFQIILTTCSDKTICQTNETIIKEISPLRKLSIQMFITNNIIDETNYDQPVTRQVMADMHFLIDPIKTLYRTADIFLNEIEILTEGGYIPTLFSKIIPNKTYSYTQEFREQTVFTNQDATSKVNIGDFYFRKSQSKIKYDRILGNLLTILSYLGGIWSTCYILFLFIANQYSHYSFVNTLSNQLYSYPSQTKKKKISKKKKEKNISSVSSPNNFHNNSEAKSIYRKIMDKIELYLSYDRKLKFTFCEMWVIIFQNIFYFIKFRNEKYLLMKKSEDNLSRDLDICNILKKLHEFDKIKSLLFTDEQLIMLGFSPKLEIISSDLDPSFLEISSLKYLSKSLKQKNKKQLLENEINFEDIRPFKQLIFAWKTLKNAKINELVNGNLLKMFGEEFSKIVDLTEEEMQIFCEQSKEKENKFIDLIKGLKNYQPEPENNEKVKIQQNFSIHSENFNNCAELPGEMILSIEGNEIETLNKSIKDENQYKIKNQTKTKINNIKGKLGLKFGAQYNESVETVNQKNIEFVGILKNDDNVFKKEEIDPKISSRNMMVDSSKRNLTEKGFLLSKNEKPYISTEKKLNREV